MDPYLGVTHDHVGVRFEIMRPDPDRELWIMADGRGWHLETTLQSVDVVGGLERQERQLYGPVKVP